MVARTDSDRGRLFPETSRGSTARATDLRLLESGVTIYQMLLQGLTPEQQAVVFAPLGESMLVAASPGAGKTHTLLARLGYLLQRQQLVHRGFLFVTFSRSGVEEAKDRLGRMEGLDSLTRNGHATLEKSFQTLHGIGRRLVESADSATLMRVCQRRPHMRVLSHAQRQAILREAIERYRRRQQASLTQPPSCPCPLFNEHDLRGLEGEEAGLATEHDPKSHQDRLVKDISVQIAERKATFIPPPALELVEETAFQWPLVDFVYVLYEKWLQHLNCIDFDDMIVMAVKLLEADGHWPNLFPNGLGVILVDEFQDTSASQLRLLKALVQRYASSICAAGDDDQCIYEWRQARPQFMTEFSRFFPRAKLLFLRQSFRCPLNIAHCANALIQHNERRLAKSIDPLPEHEHIRVRIIVGRCFEDEIAYIQRELAHLHSRTGIPWRSMAILCRIAQPLEVVRSALKQAGIPYAGADQVRMVAREPQIDRGLRLPPSSVERVWREALIQASPVISLLLLMVNEFDLHLLDNACRVYAPSMHALTKACIGQEGQRRGGVPIMQVVRDMVHHAAAFFEGFQDGAILDSEQNSQGSGRLATNTMSERLVPGFKRASAVPISEDRPKLSRGQWKACRALLSAYERLLVLAREQGSNIRLVRMLEAAQELAHETAHRHGLRMPHDTSRILRHLAQHIDAEARAQRATLSTTERCPESHASASAVPPTASDGSTGHELKPDRGEDPSPTSQQLFDALARRRRSAMPPLRASREDANAAEPATETWFEPLYRLLLSLQDVWQEGNQAFIHARRREPLDAVAVSTMHNAKGKEWPFVFILRAVNGACPLSFPDVDLEEERRIFYVGLTRARERCTILASHDQGADDANTNLQPSLFLEELSAAHSEREEWHSEQLRRRKRERQPVRANAKHTSESKSCESTLKGVGKRSRRQGISEQGPADSRSGRTF